MLVTELPLIQLAAHPSQVMFHDLGGDEWRELVKDVRERGIQQPITVSRRTGQMVIVDGHQRVRAALEVGLTTIPGVQQVYEDEKAETLALVMANIRRRHLTRDERRQVIAEMLRLYPEKSNNSHAKGLGVSDMTVKSVREELEATSQIRKLDQTVGADGKARTVNPKRQQSSSPPVEPPEPTPQLTPPPSQPQQQTLASPALPVAPPTPEPERLPAVDTSPKEEQIEPDRELEIWEVDYSMPIDLTPTPIEQYLQEVGYDEARAFERCAEKVVTALAALNRYSQGDLIAVAQSRAGRGLHAHLRLRRIHELISEVAPKLEERDGIKTITLDAMSGRGA